MSIVLINIHRTTVVNIFMGFEQADVCAYLFVPIYITQFITHFFFLNSHLAFSENITVCSNIKYDI